MRPMISLVSCSATAIKSYAPGIPALARLVGLNVQVMPWAAKDANMIVPSFMLSLGSTPQIGANDGNVLTSALGMIHSSEPVGSLAGRLATAVASSGVVSPA